MTRLRSQAVHAALAVVLGAVALLVPSAGTAAAAPGPVVTTPSGALEGRVEGGHLLWAGVPYAQPPVGPLRFRAPQPVAPWTGVRPARSAGAACSQQLAIDIPIVRSLGGSAEDCLFLNVVRPSGPAPAGGFPVMVFVPGGAYIQGEGAGNAPTPLVERGGVIVVTINYRLGPLGFLTLPRLDAESATGTSGNWGLLDQQLALRWVRGSISAFGGNPRSVTLFGESAGGNSVCQQLASPAAAGLFDRAIVQSGACVDSTLGPRTAAQAQEAGTRFAASMGCADPSTSVACLRALPDRLLVAGDTTALQSLDVTWTPTLDGNVLPRTPGEALRAGAAPRVPLLVGSNHDEGRFFTAILYHLRLNLVSESFYRDWVRDRFRAAAGAVLARYRSEDLGSPSLALSAIVTDEVFACPARWTAQAADTPGRPVWTYELDDRDPIQVVPDPIMPLGNYHGADLAYLFSAVAGLPVTRNAAQQQLSDQMVGYWTAFARTGDPNSAGLPSWPAWTPGSRPVQRLGAESGARPDSAFLDDHRCGFWATIAGR